MIKRYCDGCLKEIKNNYTTVVVVDYIGDQQEEEFCDRCMEMLEKFKDFLSNSKDPYAKEELFNFL